MIFKIDKTYAKAIKGATLSDLCCKMIEKGHYIDCEGETRSLIEKSIQANASNTQTEWFKSYKGFSITTELRKYLTTISVDGNTYSLADLDRMISKESRVLLENGPYEWDVYKTMIGTFERDRKYGNLFKLLVKARNNKYLSDLHCGGFSTMVAMFDQQNEGDYRNVFAEKSCFVFDRDTNSDISFDCNKNALFRMFCNKDSETVTDRDIYTLNQSHFHWHMWYKREIENYFTDDCFTRQGVNVDAFPSELNRRDYFLIDQSSAHGYQKSKLASIAKAMSRSDYDQMTPKVFVVDGDQLSEIQLFLLKLVKIV